MTGLACEQDDEPWWLAEIRDWIAMCLQIEGAAFRGADGWRALLGTVLEGGAYPPFGERRASGPAAVYPLYADWLLAARRERG